MRFVLAATLVLIGLAQTSVAYADGARAYAFDHPSSIIVTVMADKQTYRRGEDVRLKISVRNASASPLDLVFSGPWNDAELSVKNESGASLAPDIGTEAPGFDTSGSVTTYPLQPGETVADTLYALGAPPGIRGSDGFVSSRWWGYSFAKPGRYMVSARRWLVLNIYSPPSNPVAITVGP